MSATSDQTGATEAGAEVHRNESPVFISIREVSRRTGLSSTTIRRRVRDRSFPLPVSVGEKRVFWVESEVLAWQQDVITNNRVSEDV